MSPADDTAAPQRTAGLAPTFTPVQTEPSRASERKTRPHYVATVTATPEGTASQADVTRRPDADAAAPGTPPPRTPTRTTATIEDATGDVEWTVQRPPEYTDIATATLTRASDGYTLRLRFAAEVPQRQQDDDRTMNVASFFDVTGDGEIDYEIWANLADNGWGPSYRDRRHSEARFMADSDVQVAARGRSLVLRFPLGHLAGARTFQWATASEWGSYETIATAAAARDYAPDTGAAPFPG
ncbi:MAG: hypothetical protein GEU97_20770 [Actinophytocola sp.]|nr:hypothetical protein [Actinophytocola sp.]